MKRILSLLLIFCMLFSLPFAVNAKDANENEASNIVYLAVEDYGLIVVELNPEEAPITVANFKKLVAEDFYDGLIFHRVIESFMIQGGDPKGNGTGGADEDIKGEFSMNKVENNIKHVRGTISMARSGHPYEGYHNAGYVDIPYEEREPYYNSASSQFFIVTQTSKNNTSSLDGNYAAFGQVIEGMEVVDKIAAVKTDEKDKPTSTVRIAVATFDREEAEAALRTFPAWAIVLIVVVGVAAVVGVSALIVRSTGKKGMQSAKTNAKNAGNKKQTSNKKNRR